MMRSRTLIAALVFLQGVSIACATPPRLFDEGGNPTKQSKTIAPPRTWFIRPDGGDRNQCKGTTDAAYRRGGRQECAFKHPYYLFTNDQYGNKAWIIHGGDTIKIGRAHV